MLNKKHMLIKNDLRKKERNEERKKEKEAEDKKKEKEREKWFLFLVSENHTPS